MPRNLSCESQLSTTSSPAALFVWHMDHYPDERAGARLHPPLGNFEFAAGFIRLMSAEPADLKIEGRLLSLRRHHGNT